MNLDVEKSWNYTPATWIKSLVSSFTFDEVAGQLIGEEKIGLWKRKRDNEEEGGGEVHHSPSFSFAFDYAAEQVEDISVSMGKT